jgi:serine/threonine-protein kinase RsbW
MPDFTAELTAAPQAISDLTRRAAAFLSDSNVDARAVHHVALVLEELLTNVSAHGGGEAKVAVRLTLSDDRVSGEITDDGSAFDSTLEREVDLSGNVADRPTGGLGLLLVRKVTQSFAWERAGGRNRTTFAIGRAAAK